MAEEKKKILVVDDSGMMLRLIKAWFEEKYRVILANSGMMAMKYLAENKPDLILLDYEMPIMDGYQVLKEIRMKINMNDVPVFFLTSKDDLETVTKDKKFKAQGYIMKTMEPERIVQEVDKILNM